MRVSLILILTCFSISIYGQDCCEQFQGTWQASGKSTFEKWHQVNDTLWTGESYKLKEGEKQVLETLKLIKTKDSIIFEATVLDQNNAESISFILNSKVKDMFSFENVEHDFPKKIQYQFTSENEISIQVLGENDKGFSLILSRVE